MDSPHCVDPLSLVAVWAISTFWLLWASCAHVCVSPRRVPGRGTAWSLVTPCLTFGGTAHHGPVSVPFHLPLAMCQGSCYFPSPGLVIFFQGFFPGLRGHPCFGLSSSLPPPSTGCLSLATLTFVGLVWTQALKDRVHADVQGGRKETPAQGSACSAVGRLCYSHRGLGKPVLEASAVTWWRVLLQELEAVGFPTLWCGHRLCSP